tara:strand:- start:5928 stop:6284 length:357 start_codon:yes stop_codon:yes gene_type:complete
MQYPRRLFDAIRFVETGGEEDPSAANGLAGEIGPYQITEQYYIDALEKHPQLKGTFEECRNQYFAEWVMMAYWDRYAKGDSFEELARLHNGGPNGAALKSTQKYWELVQEALENEQTF